MVAPVEVLGAGSSVPTPTEGIKGGTPPRCPSSASRAAPVGAPAKVERSAATAVEALISHRGQVPVSVELLGDG